VEGETNSLHGSLSRDLFKIDAQISSFGTTVAHTGNGLVAALALPRSLRGPGVDGTWGEKGTPPRLLSLKT